MANSGTPSDTVRLTCRGLTFVYPGTGTTVLHNLSFSLDAPGFYALFGPSGVGKSSLARLLADNGAPYEGEIRCDGVRPLLYTYNTERLPGWGNVARHLEKVTPPARRPLLESLTGAFGVAGCLDQGFHQLSLGQKNRVNLIRYLVQDFRTLIMDESLANVDERTRETILLRIKSLFPRRFFLYISHNAVEVSKFCRRIVVLRGVGKQPQAVTVAGMDCRTEAGTRPGELDRVLLEVMNAA